MEGTADKISCSNLLKQNMKQNPADESLVRLLESLQLPVIWNYKLTSSV